MTYEQLVTRRILRPAGYEGNFDHAHKRFGRAASLLVTTAKGTCANWDLPTLAGAGALRSTATDLLTFGSRISIPRRPPLSRTLYQTRWRAAGDQ